MGGDRRWKEINMTEREFFTSIVETGAVSAEAMEYAKAKLDKLMEAAAKAAEKAAEKAAADASITAEIMDTLGVEPKTGAQILDEISADISVQKIARLLKPAVDNGTVEKVDVKADGKTRKGYKLV